MPNILLRNRILLESKKSFFQNFPTINSVYSLETLNDPSKPVVKIRRSSDNAELDFLASEISNGSLLNWVGVGNNGFISVLYDQNYASGKNAVQTTAASQPIIVQSGSLVKINERPAFLTESGTTRLFLQAPYVTASVTCSFGIVFQSNTVGVGSQYAFVSPSPSNTLQGYASNSSHIVRGSSNFFMPFDADTNPKVLAAVMNGSQSVAILNSDNFSGNAGTPEFTTLLIGSDTDARRWRGKISTLVLFESDETLNLGRLNKELNKIYKVY